ncbi:MAG: hypothetical protein ABI165_20465 [Bryobacteraceae bacterium]
MSVPRRSQTRDLLDAACPAMPFRTPDGRPFAAIPNGPCTFDAVPVYSAAFRDWMVMRFRSQFPFPPGEYALKQVCAHFASDARESYRVHPVHVRAAGGDTRIVIDRAGSNGQSIDITADGFHLESKENIYFQPSSTQLPLPIPKASVDNPFDKLQSLLRLSAESLKKCREWLAAALHPTGPYPILIVDGPSASGKTTLARALRALIDPSTAPITPHPATERQVLRHAHRGRMLLYDHVTHLAPRVLDALARVSSGASIELREPGDGGNPIAVSVSNPILLTANENWKPRADIESRAVRVSLDAIPESEQRPFDEIRDAFDLLHPALLAALCADLAGFLKSKSWPLVVRRVIPRPAVPIAPPQAAPLPASAAVAAHSTRRPRSPVPPIPSPGVHPACVVKLDEAQRPGT